MSDNHHYHGPQRLVWEFAEAMGLDRRTTPAMLTPDRAKLRQDLIEEELIEFKDACAAGDFLEMIDALCDLEYVVQGAAIEMGVDLKPFYLAVHAANMRKAGGTFREDGKYVKPAGWTPPDHRSLFLKMYPGYAHLAERKLCEFFSFGVDVGWTIGDGIGGSHCGERATHRVRRMDMKEEVPQQAFVCDTHLPNALSVGGPHEVTDP